MQAPFSQRIERLRGLLAEAGADALVVSHPANVFYLCGFTGSAGVLLVLAEPRSASARVTLFTDGRYTIQALEEVEVAEVQICRQGLLKAAGERLRACRKLRVAFEPYSLTVAQMTLLKRAAGPAPAGARAGRSVQFVHDVPHGAAGWVEALRAVKDEQEIAAMRRAARLGCAVFREVLPLVRPGVREVDLAAEIEYRMRRHGASAPAFETIVASGARAALPHARATSKRLRKNELVVFDLGAILPEASGQGAPRPAAGAGYCCDLTRTVYLGRASARIRKWYAAVLGAHQAACGVVRPGVTAGAVDAAARQVLERAGLGQYFVHSTGHGLGLEVHEEPRLAKGQKTLLAAGNVVTVEPGIYVDGVGGIRIEDDVLVTRRGAEVLTRMSRELLEL